MTTNFICLEVCVSCSSRGTPCPLMSSHREKTANQRHVYFSKIKLWTRDRSGLHYFPRVKLASIKNTKHQSVDDSLSIPASDEGTVQRFQKDAEISNFPIFLLKIKAKEMFLTIYFVSFVSIKVAHTSACTVTC